MIDEYVRVPAQWLAVGKTLPADLYVYLPQNASVLRLRSKGDVLSSDDLHSIAKIPPENLLALRRDVTSLAGVAAHELHTQLKGPAGSNSVETQAAAKTMLSGLAVEPSTSDADSSALARSLLSEITTLMEDIVRSLTKGRGVSTYEKVLARWKSQKGDLVSHHRQVSALAALIQLAVGDTSDQEFLDIVKWPLDMRLDTFVRNCGSGLTEAPPPGSIGMHWLCL